MEVKNDWANSAEYYDLVLDKKQFTKNVEFIAKTLKEHDCKTVLELGCGSGLYLLQLKDQGFDIEGLDISKEMLEELFKLNPQATTHLTDMSTFNLGKKYDAIICLTSSLVLLPNMKKIEETFKRAQEHLNPEGILILENPDHDVEIKESNHSQEIEHFNLDDGFIDIVFRQHKVKNKWVEEWFGFGFKNNDPIEFKERFEELIVPSTKISTSLKKYFIIEKSMALEQETYSLKENLEREATSVNKNNHTTIFTTFS